MEKESSSSATTVEAGTGGNEFVNALKTFNVYTENGALTNASTGTPLVDYFAKAGSYKNRQQSEVDADMNNLWNESPLVTLRIIFYLRTVSRKEKGFVETEKVQKGQGVRDEFRKAVIWLSKTHADALYENIHLIPVVGSWKDLWHPSLVTVLDRQKVFALIKRGIEDPYNAGLVAKYLPAIKSGGKISATNTDRLAQNKFAKELARYLKMTPTEYRKFKSDKKYTAHSFQRQMCNGEWDKLRFDRIPGKALFNLINHKGEDGKNAFERHNQIERYTEWLSKQPVAKFTGYVYDLFNAAKVAKTPAEKMTFNKQFDGLIELAKKDQGGISGNVWCALDTSGSMGSIVTGKTSAFDICISLGIYFSTLNTGSFKDQVIMFDNISYPKQLSGTFCDKVEQLTTEKTAWGTTNFDSVIEAIVKLRKERPEIPVADFPDTLIVVSDMQFNPVGGNEQTNYQSAMEKLAAVGLPKMRFIWWFVTAGKGGGFPSTVKDEGVTMIGGFDGSIVTMIIGGATKIVDAKTGVVRQLNAYENMLKALDQEVVRQIKIGATEEKKEEEKKN